MLRDAKARELTPTPAPRATWRAPVWGRCCVCSLYGRRSPALGADAADLAHWAWSVAAGVRRYFFGVIVRRVLISVCRGVSLCTR